MIKRSWTNFYVFYSSLECMKKKKKEFGTAKLMWIYCSFVPLSFIQYITAHFGVWHFYQREAPLLCCAHGPFEIQTLLPAAAAEKSPFSGNYWHHLSWLRQIYLLSLSFSWCILGYKFLETFLLPGLLSETRIRDLKGFTCLIWTLAMVSLWLRQGHMKV